MGRQARQTSTSVLHRQSFRTGGPHELEARHRCVDSWPRLDACAGAAAIHAAATANASSAVDHSPNPSLHGLRDELRHRIGHVPKHLQRQQFACSDVCRGSPRRSHSMLSKLLKPTARLQTGLPSSALTTRCRDQSFVKMCPHSASARDNVMITGAWPLPPPQSRPRDTGLTGRGQLSRCLGLFGASSICLSIARFAHPKITKPP
jgi:hypothetical protein